MAVKRLFTNLSVSVRVNAFACLEPFLPRDSLFLSLSNHYSPRHSKLLSLPLFVQLGSTKMRCHIALLVVAAALAVYSPGPVMAQDMFSVEGLKWNTNLPDPSRGNIGGSDGFTTGIEGYIADRECVDRRYAFDGADMLLAPQNHSLHCLLLPVCKQSGFCIMTKSISTGNWNCNYNFSILDTTNMVKAWKAYYTEAYPRDTHFVNTTNEKDLKVIVKGTYRKIGNSTTQTTLVITDVNFITRRPPSGNGQATYSWGSSVATSSGTAGQPAGEPSGTSSSQGQQSSGDIDLFKQEGCLSQQSYKDFLTAFNTTCAANPMPTLNASDTANITAWCSMPCVTLVRDKLPQFYSCMGARNATFWRYARLAICDKENGEYCGTLRDRLQQPLSCSGNTQATCEARPNCKYNGQSCSWRWPENHPTYLPCDKTGCAFRMIAAEVSVQGKLAQDLFLAIFQAYDLLFCYKDGADYCYPAIQKYITSNTTFAGDKTDLTTVGEICKAGTTKRCFFSYVGASFATSRRYADQSFFQCMERAGLTTTATAAEATRKQCHKNYYAVSSSIGRVDAYLSSYCATNTNTDSGKYCIEYFSTLAKPNNATLGCYAIVLFNKSCDASCNTLIGEAIKDGGCCLYYWNRITGGDFPVAPPGAPGAMSKQEVYGNDTASLTIGGIEPYRICAAVNGSSLDKCRGVAAGKEPPRKQMKTALKWNTIFRNATLKALLEAAFRSDTARSLSVTEDAINGSLVDSTASTKTSSRWNVLQASSSADATATYDFTIEAATPAETETASAAADKKLSSGDVSLTNTAEIGQKGQLVAATTVAVAGVDGDSGMAGTTLDIVRVGCGSRRAHVKGTKLQEATRCRLFFLPLFNRRVGFFVRLPPNVGIGGWRNTAVRTDGHVRVNTFACLEPFLPRDSLFLSLSNHYSPRHSKLLSLPLFVQLGSTKMRCHIALLVVAAALAVYSPGPVMAQDMFSVEGLKWNTNLPDPSRGNIGGSDGFTTGIEGYIADRECVDRRYAFDGADMLLAPQNHSLHCLLLPVCKQSGFCIMTKSISTGNWNCNYNFSILDTTNMVKAWKAYYTEAYPRDTHFVNTTNEKDLKVIVKGTYRKIGNSTTQTTLVITDVNFITRRPPSGNGQATYSWGSSVATSSGTAGQPAGEPSGTSSSQGQQSSGDIDLFKQEGCLSQQSYKDFLTAFNTTCAANPMPTLNASDTANITAWCSMPCVTLVRDKLPQFYSCMGARNATFWRYARLAICDKENGEYCGTLRDRLQQPLSCSGNTQATCEARPNCKYNGQSCSWRWPENHPTYLPCDKTGCAFRMIAAEVSVQGKLAQDLFLAIFQAYDLLFCYKDGADYCYPAIQKYITSNTTFAGDKTDLTTVGEICKAGTTKRCFFSYVGASFATSRRYADQSFFQCMERAGLTTTATAAEATRKQCHKNYYAVSSSIGRVDAYLSSYCATNTNTDSGKYCIEYFSTLAKPNNATLGCYAIVLFNKSCDASCNTLIGEAIKDGGCCLYYWNRITGGDFPVAPPGAPGAMSKQEVYGNDTASLTIGGIEPYRICAAVNGSSLDKCRGVAAGKEPPRKQMKTALKWNTIFRNATLKALLEAAFRSDTARSLSVTEDAINGSLVDSTASTKTSSRWNVLQASSSADATATYDFTIEAATPAETETASAAADKKLSSGDVSLTNTAAVASDCADCVATTTAAPGATTDFASSSSSSSSFLVLKSSASHVTLVALLSLAAVLLS